MATDIINLNDKLLITRYSRGQGKGLGYNIVTDYCGTQLDLEELEQLHDAIGAEICIRHGNSALAKESLRNNLNAQYGKFASQVSPEEKEALTNEGKQR